MGVTSLRVPLTLVLVCVLGAPFASGQPVGPEFRVNTYTTNTQQTARIAADSSGNFVVIWTSNLEDGSGYGVFGQRYGSVGAPLGGEFRVNTYTTNPQTSPSVASDQAGNFVVVWQSPQDGSGNGIFGQRYGSAGAPLGTEFLVNSYTTSSQGTPSVASDSAGNFVVVWQNIFTGIDGQRFGSSGAPIGTEFQVNSYQPNNQINPSVASDSAGNFVVVWQSLFQDGFLTGVFGRRFGSAGAPLGTEFQVNTYTMSDQFSPSVASDPGGNVLVVWHSFAQDGSGFGVFGQRYDGTGARLGTEFRVNTYTTYSQSTPWVASDSGGNFVVVWNSSTQDGSASGVFGQLVGSTGAPLGTEFRVNTTTTLGQLAPAVASGPGGAFVVVWGSQDGSNYGIFGQRFGCTAPAVTPPPDLTTTQTLCM